MAELIAIFLAGLAIGAAIRGWQWLLWRRAQPKPPRPAQFKVRL